jgi:hypothetical protein
MLENVLLCWDENPGRVIKTLTGIAGVFAVIMIIILI